MDTLIYILSNNLQMNEWINDLVCYQSSDESYTMLSEAYGNCQFKKGKSICEVQVPKSFPDQRKIPACTLSPY